MAPQSDFTRRIRFAFVACALTACAGAGAGPVVPAPKPVVVAEAGAPPVARARRWPDAPKRPATATFFGTPVTDDYRWLEDGTSAEVKTWVEAENALTRAHLDGLEERAAVRSRLATIMGTASPDWIAIRHAAGSLFALKAQPPKQQAMIVVLREGKELGQERVVVDPNVLDPSGKTTVDFFVPSPDGKLLAVSLSKDGSEDGDVQIFDVATGKPLPDLVPRVHGGTAGGSLAWRADGKGFWYTRYPRKGERPDADLGFYQEVWFHLLGEDPAKDLYAFGKGLPKIAEIALETSDDGKAVLAEVSNGDGGDVEQHVLVVKGASMVGPWVRLSRFEDEVAHATFGSDGRLYAITRKDAPRGKVVAFAPPFDKPSVTVLPEGENVIEDVVATKDALYAIELAGGPSAVRRVPLDPKAEPLAREAPRVPAKKPKKGPAPKPVPAVTVKPGERGVASAELPIAPVSSVTGVLRVGDDLLLRVESYTSPPAWVRYRASEHRLVRTPLAKVSPVDMTDVEVTRETCTSKDGTRVPMTVLRRRDVAKDGQRPAYLTGYGGFSVSRKPRMRSWHRLWLDAGGVVAEANLRGGSELGEAWHRAGMLTRKQNVFDDFAGCMRALVDLGYTKPEKLAIHGRSNGGLLMGATIVQHPEMFRAAVAEVGIYDMLRTELSPNGAFNVTEYGTVKDEAQFRALYAYSPVHNVKDGVAYPAVLFTTGENDPRVDPYHSRKMTARLQAATSSDRPILLRATRGTGHGMGTPLALEIEETADTIAFLMHEVGAIPAAPPPR